MTHWTHDPHPPGYNDPRPPEYQTAPPQKKGIGIAAMVMGIIALALSFIPLIGIVSFFLGGGAVILGITSLVKKNGKGQGIAGLITGGLSLLIAGIVTAMTGAILAATDETSQETNQSIEWEDTEGQAADEEAAGGETAEEEDTGGEAAEGEGDELPDSPEAYSALTVVGDEDALPEGEEGEVSVVAISEPENNTSFPIIVQNRTEESVSRVEVSGRAVGPDGETLGTGSSHLVSPNVVHPGGYAFGYVYVDSSERTFPPGSTIPEIRVDFTEGLGDYENIISLDIDNFEELPNGDLTGDATNPHNETVSGPISVDAVCFSDDEHVTDRSTYADNDEVSAGRSTTWTISSYSDPPDCMVQLISARGWSW